MKIDRHTTMAELAPFVAIISDDDKIRIREAAVRDKYGEAGFYAMSIGDFTTVLGGDIRPLLQSGGRTVYDNERIEAFKAWVDDMADTLKRMTLAPTAESILLNAGTLPSTFVESVYLFCRSYFGLKNFEDCDTLKVSEFVLAKQDDFNRQTVDRNVDNSMRKGGKP